MLFLGGTLIFPLTRLSIRLTGRPASLPSGHPMAALVVPGVVLLLWVRVPVALGGWLTAAVLVVFAVLLRAAAAALEADAEQGVHRA